MKLKVTFSFLLIFALAFTSLVFTGCGKDNEEAPEQVNLLIGNWKLTKIVVKSDKDKIPKETVVPFNVAPYQYYEFKADNTLYRYTSDKPSAGTSTRYTYNKEMPRSFIAVTGEFGFNVTDISSTSLQLEWTITYNSGLSNAYTEVTQWFLVK